MSEEEALPFDMDEFNASERKAFEAWAAEEWRNSYPPDAAWIGWRGRALLARRSSPAQAVSDDMVNCALDAADYCRNPDTAKWMRAALTAAIVAHPAPSVPPPGEVGGLVERLNSVNDIAVWQACLSVEGLCKRAASVITAQAAEAELERVSRYHATAQRQLDAVDAPLKWEGTGKGRVERVHELLAAEAALASAKAEVERLLSWIDDYDPELAEAIRDRRSLLEPSEEPKPAAPDRTSGGENG